MGFAKKAAPAVFVGRSREIEQLDRLLEDERRRLITLWGPGGAGKTTLAKQAAERARAKGANVLWVDLSASRTEREAHATLAVALNLALDGAQASDATEAIARAASAQSAFLIADNAEQMDEAARAVLVAIARRPDTFARLLVTSRDAFGVPSESAVAIEPLPEADALSLFTTLSGAEPDDDARAIVRRLDALPLAIELAAARVPLLGSAELLARLDRKLDLLGGPADRELSDRPLRHATLRAAIAWSWDLLDVTDRDALMTCATFAAPFDMSLALCAFQSDDNKTIDELTAMDAIERLRQRALVHLGAPDEEGRPQLYLLEAVRDFARQEIASAITRESERESDSPSESAWERHARAIVERTEPLAAIVRRGGAVPPTLARRRADLLAASASASSPASSSSSSSSSSSCPDNLASLAARAALALAALLSITGPPDVVVDRTHACMMQLRELAERRNRPLIARLAVAKGLALRAMGQLAEAEHAVTEATTMLEAANEESTGANPSAGEESGGNVAADPLLEADAMRALGIVARSRGDSARAIELLSGARDRYQSLGERAFAGICIGEIGAAHQSEGRLDLALTRHAEAIAIHVVEKSLRAEGVERSYLAVATHRSGDPAAAVSLHEAALAIHRRVGHRRLEGAELLHLGFVHHELGAPGPSRAAFIEARRVLATAGARGLEALAMVFIARLDADEGEASGARIALAEAAKNTPRGWPRLEATLHLVSGHLALGLDDDATAVKEYEAALASSRDVEVGFEALTPAYLALARSRLLARRRDSTNNDATISISVIEGDLELARKLTRHVTNPHIAEAFTILESASRSCAKDGEGAATTTATTPVASPTALAESSEVRRALAFAGERRGLVLGDEARRLVLPDGRAIDLSRRKNVRLILLALAKARRDHPGMPLTAEALITAGWPGERMRAEAATKRLHTAIWTLRSLGLEVALVSSEQGYFLDPKIRMDLAD